MVCTGFIWLKIGCKHGNEPWDCVKPERQILKTDGKNIFYWRSIRCSWYDCNKNKCITIEIIVNLKRNLHIVLCMVIPLKRLDNPLKAKRVPFIYGLKAYRAVNTPPRLCETSLLMLYKAKVAVCSEIYTEPIKAMWAPCRVFNLVARKVTANL
jgi:hypothetical protein